MVFKIWPEKKSRITEIEIGGEAVEVKPLTLENSLRLVLLVSPFLMTIEHRWPEIKGALETTNGTRPQLLQTIFMQLHNELAFAPGVITQALAICLGRDVAEIAEKATARDLVEAWPVLDEVNGGFRDLWEVCKHLGIVIRYEKATKD